MADDIKRNTGGPTPWSEVTLPPAAPPVPPAYKFLDAEHKFAWAGGRVISWNEAANKPTTEEEQKLWVEAGAPKPTPPVPTNGAPPSTRTEYGSHAAYDPKVMAPFDIGYASAVNAEDIQSPVVNAVPSAEQLAQQTFIADASMRLNAGIAAAEAELKKVDDALAKVKPDDTAGLKAQVEALSNAFHAMLAAESSTRQPREG